MDTDSQDSIFIKNAKSYCEQNGYDFVWFKRDIEEVFIGNSAEDNKKKTAAESFLRKKAISNVNVDKLRKSDYSSKSSNLMMVVDKYLPKK